MFVTNAFYRVTHGNEQNTRNARSYMQTTTKKAEYQKEK